MCLHEHTARIRKLDLRELGAHEQISRENLLDRLRLVDLLQVSRDGEEGAGEVTVFVHVKVREAGVPNVRSPGVVGTADGVHDLLRSKQVPPSPPRLGQIPGGRGGLQQASGRGDGPVPEKQGGQTLARKIMLNEGKGAKLGPANNNTGFQLLGSGDTKVLVYLVNGEQGANRQGWHE